MLRPVLNPELPVRLDFVTAPSGRLEDGTEYPRPCIAHNRQQYDGAATQSIPLRDSTIDRGDGVADSCAKPPQKLA